jgi:DedD protein
MSKADTAAEPASSLHRGLSVRIALALIALIVVAALAVYALTTSGTAPADAGAGPVAVSAQAMPTPKSVAVAVADDAAKPSAAEAVPEMRDAKEAMPTAATEPGSAADATVTEKPSGLASGPSEEAGAGGAAPAAAATNPAAETSTLPAMKPVRGPRLQAGVFLQAANAQAFKAKMEAQGFPVYVESRVHIGPFRDRKEAEKAREKLRELGVPTVLIAP